MFFSLSKSWLSRQFLHCGMKNYSFVVKNLNIGSCLSVCISALKYKFFPNQWRPLDKQVMEKEVRKQ